MSNEHILDRNVILISHLKLLHLLLKDAYKKLSMLANDDQKLKEEPAIKRKQRYIKKCFKRF